MTDTLLSTLDGNPIQDVLNSLDVVSQPEAPHPARREERRVYRRTCRTMVLNTPEKPVVEIVIRNINSTGVGFVSKRAFHPGDQILFFFQVQESTRLIRCEVRYCRRSLRDYYTGGALFLDTLKQPLGQEQIPLAWLGFQLTDDGLTMG